MDVKIMKLNWPIPDISEIEAVSTNIDVLFEELIRASYYGESGFGKGDGCSNVPTEKKDLFYKEQAEKFAEYLSKFRERDILSLFEEWSEDKGFADEDTKEIFKAFTEGYPQKERILTPKMNIKLRDDAIALKDIVKIVLHAIELGGQDD